MSDLPSFWGVLWPGLLFGASLFIASYWPNAAMCVPVWVLGSVTIIRLQHFAVLHWVSYQYELWQCWKAQEEKPEPKEDRNEA